MIQGGGKTMSKYVSPADYWKAKYEEALAEVLRLSNLLSAPTEALPPFVATGDLTDEEIERFTSLPHGPIQVVYPLDDEWNAAISSCQNCYSPDDSAHDWHEKMEALKHGNPKKNPNRQDIGFDKWVQERLAAAVIMRHGHDNLIYYDERSLREAWIQGYMSRPQFAASSPQPEEK